MDEATLQALYGGMTEKSLETNVEMALRHAGWLTYHTYDSRRSSPGFPDIVAVRNKRLIYRECKTQTGRLSTEQKVWKLALETAGADYGIWRPFDWGSGAILKEIE